MSKQKIETEFYGDYGFIVRIKGFNSIDEETSCETKIAVVYDHIQEKYNGVLGQVLTIIDAVIDDSKKNKSTKDLIKDKFYMSFSELYKETHLPSEVQALRENALGVNELSGHFFEGKVPEEDMKD